MLSTSIFFSWIVIFCLLYLYHTRNNSISKKPFTTVNNTGRIGDVIWNTVYTTVRNVPFPNPIRNHFVKRYNLWRVLIDDLWKRSVDWRALTNQHWPCIDDHHQDWRSIKVLMWWQVLLCFYVVIGYIKELLLYIYRFIFYL